MAALVNALDTRTSSKLGENGHTEYGWSHSIREQVIQLSFQLTRTQNEGKHESLKKKLYTILTMLTSQTVNVEQRELLITLYKMIGHTRDIISGKGEYNLTYMMINVWYDFFPSLAQYALFACVQPEVGQKEHPYGSWKDIKYFCTYCKTHGRPADHPLIHYALGLVNEQLLVDHMAHEEGRLSEITLLCKWIAREKSDKFGWMYTALACNYFSKYISSAKTADARIRAINKAKMDYRKLIAGMNRSLQTVQINQCGKTWEAIKFDKVTSVTFSKQKNAFLNIKMDGSQRTEENDRIMCAENFKKHIMKAVSGEKEVKGKRVGMEVFTKEALKVSCDVSNLGRDLLNSQWRDNASQTGALGPMVAMVDVSGSMMNDDAFYAAVALGCRVAEKSILGNRVMTFTNEVSWLNFDNAPGFVDKVKIIKNSPVGYTTNFYNALDLILDTCIEKKLEPEVVETIILAIFSDMQINEAKGGETGVLYEVMEKKYAEAGIRAVGKPYKPPHILFWNLRSGDGFPCISSQKNVSMMSGYSPALLNLFCEKGIDALTTCTPWSILMDSLSDKRYIRMEKQAIACIV